MSSDVGGDREHAPGTVRGEALQPGDEPVVAGIAAAEAAVVGADTAPGGDHVALRRGGDHAE